MAIKAERIRRAYSFQVLRVLRGSAVVDEGRASLKQQIRQAKQERVLVYLELALDYRGELPERLGEHRFSLEDSEGFFLDAEMPENGPRSELAIPGRRCEIGLLFSVYADLEPVRLWFDTEQEFDESGAPLHLAIPLAEGHSSAPGWQERAVSDLDRDAGEVGRSEVEDLFDRVGRALGWPYRHLRNGYLFRVGLSGGRRQFVLMSADYAGEGDEDGVLLRFLTLCGPVEDDGALAPELIRLNPRLAHGAFGVVQIDGREFYAMTLTRSAAAADPAELAHAIHYLARWGDEVEAQLTGGEDLR